MAGIHFLLAQHAHQQLGGEIIRKGSEAHAEHDRARRDLNRTLPFAGRQFALAAQEGSDVRFVEHGIVAPPPPEQTPLSADRRDDRGDRGPHFGLLILADRAGLPVEARQMQRRNQHQVAIRGERIALEEGACARDDLVCVGRQRALIESLRHAERMSIAQHDIQQIQRLDVVPRDQQNDVNGVDTIRPFGFREPSPDCCATTTDRGESRWYGRTVAVRRAGRRSAPR